MDEVVLSPEQEAEAERMLDVVMAGARVELREAARLLASKPDERLLGRPEFLVREAVHRLGARLVDAALEVRRKKATPGPA